MFTTDAILRRELTGLLRSKKAFMCQFAFVGLLSAVVCVAWPKEAHQVTRQAYIAQELFLTFALTQLALVSLLAPISAAGSMTTEKERATLDLLLSSPIPRRRIVIGKLLSSVALLTLLMLSGVPVLSQCYRLGGVSPAEVVWLYLTLVTVAIAFAAVGVTCSVFCQRTHSAIALSYLIVTPVAAVLLTFMEQTEAKFNGVLTFVLILNSLGITAILVQHSCDRMRQGEFWSPPRPAAEEDPSMQQGLVLDPSRFPDRLLLPPKRTGYMPDGQNPIFDRETRYEIFGAGTGATRAIILGGLFLSICFAFPPLWGWFQHRHVHTGYLMLFSAIMAAASASRSLTHEKERQTLALLSATPLRSGQIVMGKMLCACRYAGVLAGLLIFPVLVANLTAACIGVDRHFGYELALLLFPCIAITSAAALGTFFSLTSRSTAASMVATYSALFVLYAGPILAQEVLTKFTSIAADQIVCIGFLSPLAALGAIGRAMPDVTGAAAGHVGRAFREHWRLTLAMHIAVPCLLVYASIAGFELSYRRATHRR